jgi:hypothetical protein
MLADWDTLGPLDIPEGEVEELKITLEEGYSFCLI